MLARSVVCHCFQRTDCADCAQHCSLADASAVGASSAALLSAQSGRSEQWHTAAAHGLMSLPGPRPLTPSPFHAMDLEPKLFVFLLSTFLGLEVIRRVSPLLHTPLMSLTNAISAIADRGGDSGDLPKANTSFSTVLGTLAVIAATTNIVGGFWITDRMLKMFRRETRKP